ncbi:hypothetical protein BH23GEM11_BH23GEM11_06600 [soil metagenome]
MGPGPRRTPRLPRCPADPGPSGTGRRQPGAQEIDVVVREVCSHLIPGETHPGSPHAPGAHGVGVVVKGQPLGLPVQVVEGRKVLEEPGIGKGGIGSEPGVLPEVGLEKCLDPLRPSTSRLPSPSRSSSSISPHLEEGLRGPRRRGVGMTGMDGSSVQSHAAGQAQATHPAMAPGPPVPGGLGDGLTRPSPVLFPDRPPMAGRHPCAGVSPERWRLPPPPLRRDAPVPGGPASPGDLPR